MGEGGNRGGKRLADAGGDCDGDLAAGEEHGFVELGSEDHGWRGRGEVRGLLGGFCLLVCVGGAACDVGLRGALSKSVPALGRISLTRTTLAFQRRQ